MSISRPPHDHHGPPWWYWVICFLPLVLVVIALIVDVSLPWWVFLFLLCLVCLVIQFTTLRATARRRALERAERGDDEREREVRGALHRRAQELVDGLPWTVFRVRGWEVQIDGLAIRGELRGGVDVALAAFEQAAEETYGSESVVSLTEDGDGNHLALITGPATGRRLRAYRPQRRSLLFSFLLVTTFVTTTMAGAAHEGVKVFADPSGWWEGLPHALGLMAILAVHDLGHFLVARRHGVPASMPYFIPVPFALGTFGSFISLPPLLRDRREIFDIGIAGPIAGLALALPALFVGLAWSEVLPGKPEEGMFGRFHDGLDVSSSMLMALIAKLSLGADLSGGHVVELHPLAFAGWIGVLITALNLIPIGQLDGGHVGYALFGPARYRQVALAAFVALLLLGLFVYPGLLFFAFVIFFLAGTGRFPARDDLSSIGPARQAIGWASLVFLFLALAPLPRAWFGVLGFDNPYV